MNITALNTMTPLTFNSTNLTDTANLIPNLITTANTTTDGYYGLGVLIAIFLVLLFTIFRDDGDIRQDIVRSLLMSSGFTSIVGLVLLVSNIITSFVHVMWFIAIFLIMTIATLLLKNKNQ